MEDKAEGTKEEVEEVKKIEEIGKMIIFGFPIIDGDTNALMKNISPSILPNFHGLKSGDPETFFFEF